MVEIEDALRGHQPVVDGARVKENEVPQLLIGSQLGQDCLNYRTISDLAQQHFRTSGHLVMPESHAAKTSAGPSGAPTNAEPAPLPPRNALVCCLPPPSIWYSDDDHLVLMPSLAEMRQEPGLDLNGK